MENRMNVGRLVLCVITLATGYSFADPPVEKGWLTCEKKADCTSVKAGCYYWQPVNKKYAAAMKEAHPPNCELSVPAGPQPTSSCADHLCVNDPYTVKNWRLAGPDGRFILANVIGDRMNSCLHAAKVELNVDNRTFLRDSYIQQVDNDIRQKHIAEDKRLDQLMESMISCKELLTRAKSLKMD